MHNSFDEENHRPENSVVNSGENLLFKREVAVKPVVSTVTAPVHTAPAINASESVKKKRKGKKKAQSWIQTEAIEDKSIVSAVVVAPATLSNVSAVIQQQNQKFAVGATAEDSESEKEKVLAALRSFIKVMDSHKRKFLALPPGPPPRSNKKNARFYPSSDAGKQEFSNQQKAAFENADVVMQDQLTLSGKKRAREAVIGCGSFMIPNSAVKPTVAEEISEQPMELDGVVTNLSAKLASFADEADMAEAEEPIIVSVSVPSTSHSVGFDKLGGVSPQTFLRTRPSLCSPITNGLRFSASSMNDDVSGSVDCSPGSVCLDSIPNQEGSTHAITIEMFQSVESPLRLEDDTVGDVEPGTSKRAKVLGDLSGEQVSVIDFDVKKDHVEFAVQTERRGEVREMQRRYSDFQQLHTMISSLIKEQIDPLPPKQRFPFMYVVNCYFHVDYVRLNIGFGS
jgi:hypothetical protein